MGLNAQSRLSVGGLLLFGTTTSLLAKIAYELEGVGRDGNLKVFAKPWAMTTVMFLGMSICLPLAYLEEARARRGKLTAVEEPLVGNADVQEPVKPVAELRQLALLCIPTVFDLVATVLMNVGLLSVTASVYQMMRGAEMLFAALFTLVFLGRELNRKHMCGILCCVVGISLVGTSSVFGGEGSSTHEVSPKQMLAGMGLIVASQAVQAGQLTFEDFFMADLNVAPLKIVGVEGLFGSIIMLGAVLPIVQLLPGKDGKGLHEDSVDTWHMITSSRAITTVLLVDMAALLFYNLSGMCVTGYLGAVFRTVLETMRTLFVWLVWPQADGPRALATPQLLQWHSSNEPAAAALGPAPAPAAESGRTAWSDCRDSMLQHEERLPPLREGAAAWDCCSRALPCSTLSLLCIAGSSCRSCLSWILVDLLLFYTPLGFGRLGESWTEWSFLQALGFVVLVSGTLVYGRGDDREMEKEAEAEAEREEEAPAGQPGRSAAAPVPRPSTGHRPSQPIAMSGTPSSYKSTMNIGSFRPSHTPRRASFQGMSGGHHL